MGLSLVPFKLILLGMERAMLIWKHWSFFPQSIFFHKLLTITSTPFFFSFSRIAVFYAYDISFCLKGYHLSVLWSIFLEGFSGLSCWLKTSILQAIHLVSCSLRQRFIFLPLCLLCPRNSFFSHSAPSSSQYILLSYLAFLSPVILHATKAFQGFLKPYSCFSRKSR